MHYICIHLSVLTTDRATKQPLKYYPWSQKRYKEYEVKLVIVSNQCEFITDITASMRGLSDNALPVSVTMKVSMDKDGVLSHAQPLTYYPLEQSTFSVTKGTHKLGDVKRT
ncbi:hypothetical protein [Alteromonas macleodii]|uniref:hypothetical protein n=1 Tax=Alteromonas macleodii TaxID=28108 RepID=UPI001112EF47|nr:hypothetical protein [Alteromonas macleodii]